jgi:hypothetical protein
MADQPQQQQQQIQLRIDESKMHLAYANLIRTTTTGDEVVLDFGVSLPVPSQDNQPTLQFSVGSRVVMNWRGAKQLAISLGDVIRNFEKTHGEIPMGGQPARQGGTPRLSE